MTLARLMSQMRLVRKPWRCLLCAATGNGGLPEWSAHYNTNHLEEGPSH